METQSRILQLYSQPQGLLYVCLFCQAALLLRGVHIPKLLEVAVTLLP